MTPAEIKSIRAKLGLTQAQLGAMIGKAARTVMAYEAGDRKIPDSTKIILTLKVKIPRRA